jgi:hypothetical protein
MRERSSYLDEFLLQPNFYSPIHPKTIIQSQSRQPYPPASPCRLNHLRPVVHSPPASSSADPCNPSTQEGSSSLDNLLLQPIPVASSIQDGLSNLDNLVVSPIPAKEVIRPVIYFADDFTVHPCSFPSIKRSSRPLAIPRASSRRSLMETHLRNAVIRGEVEFEKIASVELKMIGSMLLIESRLFGRRR